MATKEQLMDPNWSIDALREEIRRNNSHIVILEREIERYQETNKQYRGIIKALEEAQGDRSQ